MKPVVSVVIPAQNEQANLRAVLPRLKNWRLVKEVIVIANGCTDDTAGVARRAGAHVIEVQDALGHDVGRALGACVASGKYLLFLDADIKWTVAELRPFIKALRVGADIALNRYPLRTSPYFHHPTAIAKRALNVILHRNDLEAASMTTVPHAIRSSALKTIGLAHLSVPPVAYARAVLAGLSVVAPCHVNVRTRNRWNRKPQGFRLKDVIIGDHVEAISYIIAEQGERAGRSDYLRNRTAIGAIKADDFVHEPVSEVQAVIPVRNEARTLSAVLTQLRHARVDDVCVVENGSSDDSRDIAERYGATVRHFDAALGHDVGRAVGVLTEWVPQCSLFLDGDFAVPASDITRFVRPVIEQGVDVALNDLGRVLKPRQKLDVVTTMKAFLNIAMRREDLGECSLTAVPNALSQRALREIPAEDLAVPPKALVRSVLADLKVEAVHYVDVVKPNRYRSVQHSSKRGAPLVEMIVGDHVEAMSLLLQDRGERGGFVQPRRLDLLEALQENATRGGHAGE